MVESSLEERNAFSQHSRAVGRSPLLVGILAIAALILFAASSARHLLLQSTAFDLAHFDQAIYLIGQPQPAIVSLTEYHFLGSHADWILYLLAPLYWLYPSVYWLFGVQALGLAIAALPLWYLARQAGLAPRLSLAVVLAYLLYPLVFNINLFDFHPSVLGDRVGSLAAGPRTAAGLRGDRLGTGQSLAGAGNAVGNSPLQHGGR